VVDIDINCWLL